MMTAAATAHRAVLPAGMGDGETPLKLSAGVVSGDHLFLTGMTGSTADGAMPEDPEAQFHEAFRKIGAVLQCEGLDFDSVVEMTSYHVDLKRHFDLFAQVRVTYVQPPYPAWTAVGVAELRREGALVEVKVVARMARADQTEAGT